MSGLVSLREVLLHHGFNQMPISRTFLHERFHTDEAACWWLSRSKSFREKVQERFPGVENASVLFWSLGQSVKPRELADTLSFGCRGGQADEHELDSDEYRNTAAVEMMAKICGLFNDQALRAVMSKIIGEDRNGASDPRSIHAVLKQIHRMDDRSRPDSVEILEWCALAFEAEYRTFLEDGEEWTKNPPLTVKRAKELISKQFGSQKAEEWSNLPARAEKNARERMDRMVLRLLNDKNSQHPEFWSNTACLINGERYMVPMCVIETDSHEAVKAAINAGATIVVVKKKTTGHVVVFTDRRKSIDLSAVALALRSEELAIMWENGEIAKKYPFSPQELLTRGYVRNWPELAPYWFLHDVPRDAANQLYNGSESARGVMPTRIPLETIVKIVKVILGGQFHPLFYKGCLGGKCVGSRCPWFPWELGRCKGPIENTFGSRR